MSSTRLPGKVLRTVLGRPLLSYQLERLREIRAGLQIVVATTTSSIDDSIVRLCEELGVPVHRGPEADVLERYSQAAERFGADPIVRITADCPLIDPDVSRRVLGRYEAGDCDYASNTVTRTYPRGLDTEVFSRAALLLARKRAHLPHQREHVTPFLYETDGTFRVCGIAEEIDLSGLRWTVDTEEDFVLVSTIIERLYPSNPTFRTVDILQLLKRDRALTRLNASVKQKSFDDLG